MVKSLPPRFIFDVGGYGPSFIIRRQRLEKAVWKQACKDTELLLTRAEVRLNLGLVILSPLWTALSTVVSGMNPPWNDFQKRHRSGRRILC